MYHALLIVSVLLSLPIKSKKPTLVFVSFMLIFFFLALRYNFGNDYMAYFNIHESLHSTTKSPAGSSLFYKYLNLSLPSFFQVIAVISAIYAAVFYLFITRNLNRSQYWLGVLILLLNPYLFLIHSSALRQTLAICFFIIAAHFAKKRNAVLYFSFVLAAFGFHTSAIILLPFYFILTEKKINVAYIFIGLTIILFLLFSSLFDYAMSEFLKLFPGYAIYYENAVQSSLRSFSLSLFFFIFILININKLDGDKIVFAKLGLISAALSLFTIKFAMISRFGMYFDVFLIVALPCLLSTIKSLPLRWLCLYFIVLIYMLRYVSFFNTPLWEPFFNYQTIMFS